MNWSISSQDNYGIEIRYEKSNILGTNSCMNNFLCLFLINQKKKNTSNKNYKLVILVKKNYKT